MTSSDMKKVSTKALPCWAYWRDWPMKSQA